MTEIHTHPTLPYTDPTNHLLDLMEWVALALRRYLVRHNHRLSQADGRPNDLVVSLTEVRHWTGQKSPKDTETSFFPTGVLPMWLDVIAEDRALAEHAQRVRDRTSAQAITPTDTDTDEAPFVSPEPLPIEQIRELFQLTEHQVLLWIAAAIPTLSVDMARLYRFAWADFTRQRPTVGFLSELFADTPTDVWTLCDELNSNSRLVREALVRVDPTTIDGEPLPLIERTVLVPDEVIRRIHGATPDLPAEWLPFTEARPPHDTRVRSPLWINDGITRRLETILREGFRTPRHKMVVALYGDRGSGRRTLTCALLSEAGIGTMMVDVDRLLSSTATERHGLDLTSLLRAIGRETLLRRAGLLLRLDSWSENSPSPENTQSADRLYVERVLHEFVHGFGGLVVLLVHKRTEAVSRIVAAGYEVFFERPTRAQQRGRWQQLLEQVGCPDAEPLATRLAVRLDTTPGQAQAAVERAQKEVRLRPRGEKSIRFADVVGGYGRSTTHGLLALAEPVDSQLTWENVVLPEESLSLLKQIVHHAAHHDKVFGEWGFHKTMPYGRGLSCLFHGPPGTGKTMMATVIANSLDRTLYRVDISRIASKWVGETEKNLARLFDEAEVAQAILLFDEADSLFSKRTAVQTANDRFANMEVNYLLQRMETFEGISILTTNLETAVDEAFMRRIRFRVRFPAPDAHARSLLWQMLLPPEAPKHKDVDFELLGELFELSGGHIRNAVIRAAFAAATVGEAIAMHHLEESATAEARELGMVVRSENLTA